MKIVKKLQAGGYVEDPNAAAVNGGAPAQGGQDPMQAIVELFVNGLQNQDCNALAQGAQLFLELVQQAQGEAAPAGQPVFAKGGKIVSRKQSSIKLVCE